MAKTFAGSSCQQFRQRGYGLSETETQNRNPEPLASGNVRQLTVRAILTGCVIGALLTPCNVYSGLKIGWSFNMSIAAALLSFAFWKVAGVLFKTPDWGLLENNINQTTASAAASIISAGIVAPIPALTILTGKTLAWPILAVWCFIVSFTGVVVAVGLRKQMLLEEKLPFPAGMATAETVKEIYAKGQEAMQRVKVLLGAGVLSGGLKLFSDFVHTLSKLPLFGSAGFGASAALKAQGLSKITLANLGFVLDPSLLMIGFGGIIGIRAGISLLLGAIFSWGILGPWVLSQGWAQAGAADGYWFGSMVEWLLWPGVSMMVTSALTSFGLTLWNSHQRKKARLSSASETSTEEAPPHDEHEFAAYYALPEKDREIPRSWFLGGLGLALVMATVGQIAIFGITPWIAVLAIFLTFFLAVVSSKVSGETGIAPIGALGKVTQMTFGLINPGDFSANLMTANVTGGAAGQSSDLLHDLKTGLLIGATPRLQIVGQVFGIMVGALVGAAAYLILIPDPAHMLLTPEWPAPAVATWKAIAEVFKAGPEAIPPGSIVAMIIGALVGIVLPLLEHFLPEKIARWLPSPASFGLAFMLPAWNSISMFLGAALAYAFNKFAPNAATRFLMVIAAGLVAGESLAGIAGAVSGFLGF